jgi:hypothetical protein
LLLIYLCLDHDFGKDNAGKNYPYKEESREMFLHYMADSFQTSKSHNNNTTEDNNNNDNNDDGVYSIHTYGSEGHIIKIILLDIRYNRDDYNNNTNGDFLGIKQWNWLIQQLLTINTTDILIIGSSIQVLPDDKPFCIETWNKFKHSRKRLISALISTKSPYVFIISGDIHYAEFNKAIITTIYNNTNNNNNIILSEITSSGLTHAWGEGDGSSTLIGKTFYTFIFFIGQYFIPFYYREKSNSHWYSGLNFGIIDITWNYNSNTNNNDNNSDKIISSPMIIGKIYNKNGDVIISEIIQPIRNVYHHILNNNDNNNNNINEDDNN